MSLVFSLGKALEGYACYDGHTVIAQIKVNSAPIVGHSIVFKFEAKFLAKMAS